MGTVRKTSLLVALASAGAAIGACGATHAHVGISSHGVLSSADTATIAEQRIAAARGYQGDGDDDTGVSGNGAGGGNGSYHDSDDEIASFGTPAGGGERRAIATLVGRYYAVAAAGDGTKACSMMYGPMAESVAEVYGRNAGPSYMRGNSCSTVLRRLFEHQRRTELSGVFAVTGVRVRRNLALVLLGSRTMRASQLLVRRERGVWKVDSLLGEPLT